MTHKHSGLAAQIKPIDCPACGQKVRVPTIEMLVNEYGISPLEERILRAVWGGRGMPVPTERIFTAMYADDPDGGPSTHKMYASFKVALHHLRNALKGSGIGVETVGYSRGYRLILGAD